MVAKRLPLQLVLDHVRQVLTSDRRYAAMSLIFLVLRVVLTILDQHEGRQF
jgi:hypothetical protein